MRKSCDSDRYLPYTTDRYSNADRGKPAYVVNLSGMCSVSQKTMTTFVGVVVLRYKHHTTHLV